MKIVIDIPEMAYEAYKEWHKNKVATVEQSLIAQGAPYEARPTGEWIVGEYMDCHSDILPEYTCPFCGEVEYRKYDFCHCGADMRVKGGRE